MSNPPTKVVFRLEFSAMTILFGCFMFSMGWFLCDLTPFFHMLIESITYPYWPQLPPPPC